MRWTSAITCTSGCNSRMPPRSARKRHGKPAPRACCRRRKIVRDWIRPSARRSTARRWGAPSDWHPAIRRQPVQQARELLGGGKFQRDAGRLHPSTRELQLCASVPRNYGNERHRHLIHHHDQLDAFGIAMRFARASSLARCERGAMAAEFAVLFSALVSTLLGIIWASLLT